MNLKHVSQEKHFVELASWRIVFSILWWTPVAKIIGNSHLVAEDEAKAHLARLQNVTQDRIWHNFRKKGMW